ncbi:MAG: hypothetical protein IPJ23_03100 [Ignavibacteriales bacterium]|nr:hypothetical protein [Ignavibacteriales bacterium]
MTVDSQRPYNERLFSKGLRSKIHYSRFYWLKSKMEQLNCFPESVLELGCFDAKTIHFLPKSLKRYVGLDANFEGGLTQARNNWKIEGYDFYDCKTPQDINLSEEFHISICMETFELIDNQYLEDYIIKLASLTKQFIFVTTSNQVGIGFAIKHIIKKLLGYGVPHYSITEFFYASIGRVDKIERSFRKGWHHKSVLKILQKHFDIIEVSRYPYNFLPGFGVCIIGKRQQKG